MRAEVSVELILMYWRGEGGGGSYETKTNKQNRNSPQKTKKDNKEKRNLTQKKEGRVFGGVFRRQGGGVGCQTKINKQNRNNPTEKKEKKRKCLYFLKGVTGISVVGRGCSKVKFSKQTRTKKTN